MWTKRTSQELADELLVRRAAMGASTLLLAFLIFVAAMPGKVLNIMPSARIVAAVFAGALLLGWRWKAQERRARSSAMHCEQCHSLKINQPESTCVCGGKLTPLREMKWIEAPAPESIPSPAPAPQETVLV